MSEIITYKGKDLSMGTCMNLGNVSYTKLFMAYSCGQLKQCSLANLTPEQYLAPDSAFRFRFPFVDEKDLQLGAELDFWKTVPVNITDNFGELQTVYISYQKCIIRENRKSAYLATLYRDASGMNITQLSDQQDAVDFCIQIVFNHIFKEPDALKQKCYRNLVTEILDGYHQSICLIQK